MTLWYGLLAFIFLSTQFAPSVANSAEMQFTSGWSGGNCLGCEWTQADGEITSDTPQRFREYLQNNSIGYALALNSDGGDLAAGVELGKIFRQEGLRVSVGRTVPLQDTGLGQSRTVNEGARCLSACAYAFLGGSIRRIEEDGQLGFHQFADEALDEKQSITTSGLAASIASAREQYVTGFLVDYINRMGISAELYPLAAAAPPDGFHFVSQSEAMRLGIDNSADNAETWTALPFGEKGLIAEITTSTSQRQLRLYCTSSGRYHLTVLLPVGWYGDIKDMKARYESMGPHLTIFTESAAVRVRITDVLTMSKTGRTVVVTEVDREGAEHLAKAFAFDVRTEDHFIRASESVFYDVFEVNRIGGGHDIAKAVFRLCI
ncbi:hypothetical protein [uncultured Hoeflea sp.]|uniref:COG3904 family protein n=1 Tax=uncultured Hoeflea sp. TaxID=538666 RepID=UPI0030EFA081